MWKSYKAFMKKSDRIQFYLLYPACCIFFYALLLWIMTRRLSAEEIIDSFEIHFGLEAVNSWTVAWTILFSAAYFLTDYASLMELFWKKRENLYFLRRSCKGRQVMQGAVKMDFLLRLGSLALIFGGSVFVELLIGTRFHFSFRSLKAQGYFCLSGIVICFTMVTLVVTLCRIFPGYIKSALFIYLGMMLEIAMSILSERHFMTVVVLMVLCALLVAGNLALANRRWKEGIVDEKGD